MTRRKGERNFHWQQKTMENDEILVNFVTGDEVALVIEDGECTLKPRADGNDKLHRFLTIATLSPLNALRQQQYGCLQTSGIVLPTLFSL